jgi:hypothetical protein
MEQQPLPEGTLLNVVVFEDAREAMLAEFAQRGVVVLAESRSPFGPLLTLRPAEAGWFDLARLPGVEIVEMSRARVPANDLSRVRIGVAMDTRTSSISQPRGQQRDRKPERHRCSTNHPDLIGLVV